MTNLTEQQKKFAEEYLIDLNATQAAIRAKYSKKTAKEQGARLLTNVNVKSYLEEKLAELQSARIADTTEVMEYLTSVLRGEQSEQIPLLCGEGIQELTDKDINAKDRLKAAELLGKRYGLFTDKVNIEGAVPVVIIDDVDEEDE